jgi:glycosyltransferase involved in cell wall biosynthesis
MHLVIVGPGIMPIPPKGWGAVESLIWDYKIFLEKYHPDIRVTIVNEPNPYTIVQQVNDANPDVVHIQYDNYIPIVSGIKCKHILATSHYGYLHKERLRSDPYFGRIFPIFVKSRAIIAALSPEIADIYRQMGVPDSRLVVMPNGANDDIFRYTETPAHPDRTLYLGKVEQRKRQAVYQHIPNLWFAGNCIDSRFNTKTPRYLGEWMKPTLYEHLTDYANLALISDGEAHALVCCEALICGLGLVISEYATANLDLSLPFITVIPRDKMDDVSYVADAIAKNREISVRMRSEIRAYGLANFSWRVATARYAAFCRSLS